jgi:hypothetical protein
MDIQLELQKIHHQFGTSEKANYEIQKLFDNYVEEEVKKALKNSKSNVACLHDFIDKYGVFTCQLCGEEML